ncbi:MAG: glycosyltransferase family 1 protein [Planctomycetes bacterium]|nr:glycosyltransferase family 1 protein [Planctomycetota bacterium]
MPALKSTRAPELLQPNAIASWADECERLEDMAQQSGPTAVLDRIKVLLKAHPASTEAHLLAGRLLARFGEFEGASSLYREAHRLALEGSLSEDHPDTPFSVAAQLGVDPEKLPIREKLEAHLNRNLNALKEADPELAAGIAGAEPPEPLRIIEVWGKLMIGNSRTGRVAVASKKMAGDIRALIKTGASVAFCGIGSGLEILHCLESTPKGFLGYTFAHYLLEKDLSLLKLFFKLEDLSPEIQERRLILFGGPGWWDALKRHFSSRRFELPGNFIGDRTPYLPECDRIQEMIEVRASALEDIQNYYESEGFRSRMKAIALGQELPKVLFLTCRWTTVLQYVCASFRKGFEELGCPTELLVEKTNVERLTRGVYFDALERLKPDLAFAVTHSRLSYDFLPSQLPFICFAMDNVGPILKLQRVDGLIQKADLFFCISRWFKEYHARKGVPPEQLFHIATPGDPAVYRPLDPRDPLLEPYRAEVAFMKHGGEEVERCMRRFESGLPDPSGDPFWIKAREALREIHRQVLADRSRSWFEADFWNKAGELLPGGIPAEQSESLRVFLTRYLSEVYAVSYRQHFLEPLARSGIRLRLYGNGWESHPLFSTLAGGSVPPGEKLNAAYNGSSILLHIHQGGSMHQRMVEGALAGGFFLINKLDPAKSHAPLEAYFEEGREVVAFDSAKDLLEKCRYYLEHEEERRAIAGRMRERALGEHTIHEAAGRVLEAFRRRLRDLV